MRRAREVFVDASWDSRKSKAEQWAHQYSPRGDIPFYFYGGNTATVAIVAARQTGQAPPTRLGSEASSAIMAGPDVAVRAITNPMHQSVRI
jgi:hypothetical protein